jgi:hypothetical protein
MKQLCGEQSLSSVTSDHSTGKTSHWETICITGTVLFLEEIDGERQGFNMFIIILWLISDDSEAVAISDLGTEFLYSPRKIKVGERQKFHPKHFFFLFLRTRGLIINKLYIVRFGVFTAVTVKNAVFLDVMPRDFCKNLQFWGM